VDRDGRDARPVTAVLGVFTATIGLPFFVLASTGPLFQSWIGRADRAFPVYRLYAVSNLASMLALLAYPVAVEPNLSRVGADPRMVVGVRRICAARGRRGPRGGTASGVGGGARGRGGRPGSHARRSPSLDRAPGGDLGAPDLDDERALPRRRVGAVPVDRAARRVPPDLRARFRRGPLLPAVGRGGAPRPEPLRCVLGARRCGAARGPHRRVRRGALISR
jgi:hypothetical protein